MELKIPRRACTNGVFSVPLRLPLSVNKSELPHRHCTGLFSLTGLYSLCSGHRTPAGSRRHRHIPHTVPSGMRVYRYTVSSLVYRHPLTYILSSSHNEVMDFDLLFSAFQNEVLYSSYSASQRPDAPHGSASPVEATLSPRSCASVLPPKEARAIVII